MARVLFVDQFGDIGGGQTILLDLIKEFSERGTQCAVALPEAGPLTNLLANRGVKLYRFGFPALTAGKKTLLDQLRYFPATGSAAKQIAGFAHEFGADAIFCNAPRLIPASVQAACRLHIPVTCAIHLLFKGKERSLLSWYLKKPAVAGVVACSTFAAAPFQEIAGSKPFVVGNWVSPRFLSEPSTARAKASLGLSEDSVAVGVVGRISRSKGQLFFLRAVLPLLDQDPNLHILFAGGSDFEDPAEERLLRNFAEGAKQNRIHLLGKVTDSIPVIDALDVAVVPSLWEEPFGLVAVEAMARRKPVIATLSGGLKEVVVNGLTGLLVEKEEESLRNAVRQLASDPGERSRMGEAGRIRVESEFAGGKKMEQIFRLCNGTEHNKMARFMQEV